MALTKRHTMAIMAIVTTKWFRTQGPLLAAIAAEHDRLDWEYFRGTNLDPRLDQWDNRRK